MKARTYMEPLEQGKGFDLKIAPFEIADEIKELIKQRATLQVNHFSFSQSRLSPSGSTTPAGPMRYPKGTEMQRS